MTIIFKPLTDAPRNELETFSFGSLELRVLMMRNEPWFLGMDVIAALDLEAPGRAYSRLDACERHNMPRTHIGMRGGRDIIAVSESGLYKLIMRSDKPEARKFQDWVTRDVLPAIRKTGGYLLNEEAREPVEITPHIRRSLTTETSKGRQKGRSSC